METQLLTGPPKRRGRRWRVLALAVLALPLTIVCVPAVTGTPTQPMAADRTSDSRSTDSLDAKTLLVMRHQESLGPAVKLLYEQARRSPGSGFMGVAFEGEGISLYWKGDLPPGMKKTLEMARAVGPITVRPARFSLAELEAAAAKIEAAANPTNGGDIQEIIVKHDGTGLEVLKMPAETAAAVRAKAAALGRGVPGAEQIIPDLGLRVPVTVKPAGAPIQLLSCASTCNRQDDTSPWNGGTYLIVDNTPTGDKHCTFGFGVVKGGQSYLLTAAHCATDELVYDYTWERIGGVYQEDWDKDLLLINARGYGHIFDGSATTGRAKGVKSYGYPVVNELLCQSGSTSGTVCGLKSLDGSYTTYGCDFDGNCYNWHSMAKAQQIHNLPAVRPGDSGGSVFSLDGTGVRAKGIVSSTPTGDATTLYYQDWETIESSLGAYPVIG